MTTLLGDVIPITDYPPMIRGTLRLILQLKDSFLSCFNLVEEYRDALLQCQRSCGRDLVVYKLTHGLADIKRLRDDLESLEAQARGLAVRNGHLRDYLLRQYAKVDENGVSHFPIEVLSRLASDERDSNKKSQHQGFALVGNVLPPPVSAPDNVERALHGGLEYYNNTINVDQLEIPAEIDLATSTTENGTRLLPVVEFYRGLYFLQMHFQPTADKEVLLLQIISCAYSLSQLWFEPRAFKNISLENDRIVMCQAANYAMPVVTRQMSIAERAFAWPTMPNYGLSTASGTMRDRLLEIETDVVQLASRLQGCLALVRAKLAQDKRIEAYYFQHTAAQENLRRTLLRGLQNQRTYIDCLETQNDRLAGLATKLDPSFVKNAQFDELTGPAPPISYSSTDPTMNELNQNGMRTSVNLTKTENNLAQFDKTWEPSTDITSSEPMKTFNIKTGPPDGFGQELNDSGTVLRTNQIPENSGENQLGQAISQPSKPVDPLPQPTQPSAEPPTETSQPKVQPSVEMTQPSIQPPVEPTQQSSLPYVESTLEANSAPTQPPVKPNQAPIESSVESTKSITPPESGRLPSSDPILATEPNQQQPDQPNQQSDNVDSQNSQLSDETAAPDANVSASSGRYPSALFGRIGSKAQKLLTGKSKVPSYSASHSSSTPPIDLIDPRQLKKYKPTAVDNLLIGIDSVATGGAGMLPDLSEQHISSLFDYEHYETGASGSRKSAKPQKVYKSQDVRNAAPYLRTPSGQSLQVDSIEAPAMVGPQPVSVISFQSDDTQKHKKNISRNYSNAYQEKHLHSTSEVGEDFIPADETIASLRHQRLMSHPQRTGKNYDTNGNASGCHLPQINSKYTKPTRKPFRSVSVSAIRSGTATNHRYHPSIFSKQSKEFGENFIDYSEQEPCDDEDIWPILQHANHNRYVEPEYRNSVQHVPEVNSTGCGSACVPDWLRRSSSKTNKAEDLLNEPKRSALNRALVAHRCRLVETILQADEERLEELITLLLKK